ncbi:ABC transporter substrate-binding protein [Paeniroseomonas aquatica]|uniref:ABC transporter substrate-binding protein n=1 Tax=Paeniroseomonas aquatica TaxID=373043 RepID=UPI0036164A92
MPRDEPAEAASGGKRVHFDRLELVWIPDGGTAAAALRTGEIDWIEYPLPDLVPVLQRDRGIGTQVYDPNGFLGFLRFNHLHPPFDDVAVRRAIRDVLVQPDYMAAVALPGDWSECHAVFPCGLPQVREFPAAPRGEAAMDNARAALKAAGYAGERIVHINPSDFPAVTQQGRVTADLMRRLGMNVELVESDWATIIARRANKGTPAQGGWSLHNTISRRPISPTPRSARSSAAMASAPGSAGRPTSPARRRWSAGSAPPMPRPRPRPWRRCRRRPGTACPSRRPGCSGCGPPSAPSCAACCRAEPLPVEPQAGVAGLSRGSAAPPVPASGRRR